MGEFAIGSVSIACTASHAPANPYYLVVLMAFGSCRHGDPITAADHVADALFNHLEFVIRINAQG